MKGGERDGSASAFVWLGLAALYTALALVFTYPLGLHFTTHYAGEGGGDAPIYVWNLWWVKKAILDLHQSPLETDYIFYPLGIDLSLHTLALLHGLVFIPLSALVGAVAGSNLIVLGTFPASALATYGLARDLGANRAAALLSGLAFGYCPYRLARLAGHYDLLSTEWLPLYALVFLRAMQPGASWRLPVAAGLVAALCGYTSLTYLVFLAFWTALWIAMRFGRRECWRAAIVAGVALLLLEPLLARIYESLTAWRYPAYPGAERYAADVMSYLLPSPRQNLLGGFGRSYDANLTESTVFPGYVALALAASALVASTVRRERRFWIVLGAVSFVLSLGSSLAVAGSRTGIPLPFAIVEALPVLTNLRAPARFSILVMLSVSVLVASGWSALTNDRTGSSRWALTGLAAGLFIIESLSLPAPVFAARVPDVVTRIAAEPGDFTVVEIPGIDQVPGEIMLHQTVHEKRILIGSAARVPLDKTSYYYGLPLVRPLVDLRKEKTTLTPELVAREKEHAPEVAAFLKLRYVLVDPAYEKRGVVSFLENVLPVDREPSGEGVVTLRVRESNLPPLPFRLDPGSEVSRLYFASGWSPPERENDRRFRWANESQSWILFRRPVSGPLALVIRLASLPGLAAPGFEARLNGVRIGEHTLTSTWQDFRLPLPSAPEDVERLELIWAQRGEPSPGDPRRLAARVSDARFER